MADKGVWGIILAAGAGQRFGARKQFLPLVGDERLVDACVRATRQACGGVVLVLPPGTAWDGPAVDVVVEGGTTRNASMRSGLAAVPSSAEIVVLHAASHPLAHPSTFDAVIEQVRAGAAAAVPGLRPPEVVRRVTEGLLTEDLGRDDLVLIQSPIALRTSVLRELSERAGDDVVEETHLLLAAGEQVAVVPGDPHNVHVTNEADLELARALLRTTDTPEVG